MRDDVPHLVEAGTVLRVVVEGAGLDPQRIQRGEGVEDRIDNADRAVEGGCELFLGHRGHGLQPNRKPVRSTSAAMSTRCL